MARIYFLSCICPLSLTVAIHRRLWCVTLSALDSCVLASFFVFLLTNTVYTRALTQPVTLSPPTQVTSSRVESFLGLFIIVSACVLVLLLRYAFLNVYVCHFTAIIVVLFFVPRCPLLHLLLRTFCPAFISFVLPQYILLLLFY